jgi:hypothetical protein
MVRMRRRPDLGLTDGTLSAGPVGGQVARIRSRRVQGGDQRGRGARQDRDLSRRLGVACGSAVGGQRALARRGGLAVSQVLAVLVFSTGLPDGSADVVVVGANSEGHARALGSQDAAVLVRVAREQRVVAVPAHPEEARLEAGAVRVVDTRLGRVRVAPPSVGTSIEPETSSMMYMSSGKRCASTRSAAQSSPWLLVPPVPPLSLGTSTQPPSCGQLSCVSVLVAGSKHLRSSAA